MRFTPHAASLLALAFAASFLVGCGPAPSPVSVRSMKELNGPPDLVKNAKPDPRWRAIQLQTFQVNHVWAGSGYSENGGKPYRAKITVWGYGEGGAAAEIYFHELGEDVPNPDPNQPGVTRPYQLHFPVTAAGPILQALRNANEPVYLFYYQNQWAVGISEPEAIGVD